MINFMTSLIGGGISPLHSATLSFDIPVLIVMVLAYVTMKIFEKRKRSD